jgi:hypothetical protein
MRRTMTDYRCARIVNYIAGIMSFVKFLATISAVEGEQHAGEPHGLASRAHAGSRRELQYG